jgi:hypothetical protein
MGLHAFSNFDISSSKRYLLLPFSSSSSKIGSFSSTNDASVGQAVSTFSFIDGVQWRNMSARNSLVAAIAHYSCGKAFLLCSTLCEKV